MCGRLFLWDGTVGTERPGAAGGRPAFCMPPLVGRIPMREKGGWGLRRSDGVRRPGAGRAWRTGLARALELPPDVLTDLPRLLWLGGDSMTLENHRGIVEYTPRLVRIRVRHGQVIVEGANLEIERMTDADISLRGDVTAVRMERPRDRLDP